MTLQLLSVIDDFERAFVALPPELRTLTWIEGVYMIGSKMFGMLQARGLNPIEAQGQEFDPHLHDAITAEIDPDAAPDTVIEELQPGYRLGEKVIRAAKVKVSKAA